MCVSHEQVTEKESVKEMKPPVHIQSSSHFALTPVCPKLLALDTLASLNFCILYRKSWHKNSEGIRWQHFLVIL